MCPVQSVTYVSGRTGGYGVPSRNCEGPQLRHFMFYCYILECSDRSFYVGVTDDPTAREQTNNQGRGADWTAARRPVHLVWTEEHLTLSSARHRENQLKRWNRAKKAALIRGSLRLRSGQA